MRDQHYSKEHNNARHDLLEKLDRKEKVSNNELIYYGLTFAIDENKEDIITITQKLNKLNNKFIHLDNKDISMFPEQKSALNFLSDEKKKKKILLAQTSFGKTLLVKEMIYRNSNRYNKIAFVAPTNALSFEIAKDLKETKIATELGYKIYDSKLEDEDNLDYIKDEKIIFVGTQEKLITLDEFDFELVIIDEAYKLRSEGKDKDDGRLFLLNEALTKFVKREDIEIILLSPICDISDNFGVDGKSIFFKHINYFNPVSTIYEKIKKTQLEKILSEKSKERTILFIDQKHKVRHLVKKIPAAFENNYPKKTIEYLNDVYTEGWPVVNAINKGALIHIGIIPKFLQEYAVEIFDKNESGLMIATNSIAEGVNTKTKNIIIDTKIESSNLLNDNEMLVKNLIGRAGRLGVYNIGYIYSFMEKDEFENRYIDNKKLPIVKMISDEEHQSNKPSKAKDVIDDLTNETNLEINDVVESVEKLGLTKKYFKRLKEALSVNYNHESFTNILFIHYYINGEKTIGNKEFDLSDLIEHNQSNRRFREDKERLEFVMGDYTTKGKEDSYEQVPLTTLEQRIALRLNWKYKEKNVDPNLHHFLSMRNSTAQFDLKKIAEKGLEIINDPNINIRIGQNVIKILNNFNSYYFKNLLERNDSSKLRVNDKTVLMKLFEHGIDTSSKSLPLHSLQLIVNNLNRRFSMFDIRREISSLQKEDENIRRIKEIFFHFD